MSMLSRTFVVAAVLAVVSFVGASVPVTAQPPQDPKHDKEKGRGHEGQPPQAQPQRGREQPPQQQAAQPQRGREQRPQQQAVQPQRGREQRPQQQTAQPQRAQPPAPQAQRAQAQRQAPQRLAESQQQQRIGQQQQRLVQYGAQLDQQQRLVAQQGVQLQQQKRTAQYGFQQRYAARLREQQLSIQNTRNYNYGGDPYFYTPYSYRYLRAGRYYETNDYGATVLRQAVNYGYEEGFEAGRADRQDQWRYDYQNSYAYLDGNYGYSGFYIERDDYNYYFREGFRRGYEDGYYSRSRYGAYTGGRYTVLGPELNVIITFQPLR